MAASFIVWLFPIFFFAYQFVLRLFPGLVMPELLVHYEVSAAAFGWLASIYYFGYASMQIPIAMLLDGKSPRWVLFVCISLCGLGAYGMVISDSWFIACLSRFLVGAGSAAGFLGVSKVIAQWFPSHWYARMVGFSFTLGLSGAIFGGKPTSLLIAAQGWQWTLSMLAMLGLLLAIAVVIIVRQPKQGLANEAQAPAINLNAVKAVFSKPALIWLAIANLLMVGSLEGFADVWGVSYFMLIYDLSKSDAAAMTSIIFLGMIFGSPMLGYFSEKFKCHFLIMTLCALSMAVIFGLLLVLGGTIPLVLTKTLMFLIGVFCCYQVVVFAIGAQMVPLALISVAIAFLNSVNMLGGTFFHTTIGQLMDWQVNHWGTATATAGSGHYEIAHYSLALSIIPLSALLGGLCVVIAKRVAR